MLAAAAATKQNFNEFLESLRCFTQTDGAGIAFPCGVGFWEFGVWVNFGGFEVQDLGL